MSLHHIIISCFLDTTALALCIPISAAYLGSFGINNFNQGLLASANALCSCLTGPWIGRLSDSHGRVPLLRAGATVSSLGFLAAAFAHSIHMAVAARILPGLVKCQASCAQAYISDVSDPASRPRNMGLLGVAFGAAFILGPALGGVLTARLGARAPFLAAAAFSALNALLATCALAESKQVTPAAAAAEPQGDGGGSEAAKGSRALVLLGFSAPAPAPPVLSHHRRRRQRGLSGSGGGGYGGEGGGGDGGGGVAWYTQSPRWGSLGSLGRYLGSSAAAAVEVPVAPSGGAGGAGEERRAGVAVEEEQEGEPAVAAAAADDDPEDEAKTGGDSRGGGGATAQSAAAAAAARSRGAPMRRLLASKLAFSLSRSSYEALFTQHAGQRFGLGGADMAKLLTLVGVVGMGVNLASRASLPALLRRQRHRPGKETTEKEEKEREPPLSPSPAAAMAASSSAASASASSSSCAAAAAAASSSPCPRSSQWARVPVRVAHLQRGGGGERSGEGSSSGCRRDLAKLITMSLVQTAFLMEWGLARSWVRFLCAVAALSASSNMYTALVFALFSTEAARVAPEAVGELIGFSSSLDTLARVVAPLAGGLLLHWHGPAVLGCCSAAAALLSAVPLLVAYRAAAAAPAAPAPAAAVQGDRTRRQGEGLSQPTEPKSKKSSEAGRRSKKED